MSEYVIRPLTADELKVAVDWAGREGWNPGHHDAACFHGADSGGFLGGFLDGEMIASISVVRYDETFGFLGFYIVRPEFRGSGHGLEIWRHALANCNALNIGLDGVVDQQHNYRKSGFAFAYNNYRFAGTARCMLAKLKTGPVAQISDLSSVSDDLRTYDRGLFPASRDVFLEHWLSASGHVSKVYADTGGIRGYATLRPCLNGYKIGPLFADTGEIAKALLGAILGALPEQHSEHEVFVDIPQPNASAMALADELRLSRVFETARMYSNHEPDIDLNRIFGVTTFELG